MYTDFDFYSAFTNPFFEHSLLMFQNFLKQVDSAAFKSDNNKRKIFEALPHDFKPAEAIEPGKKASIPTRSVDASLKELNGRYLVLPQFGCYSKT